jgi:hypothetical protein
MRKTAVLVEAKEALEELFLDNRSEDSIEKYAAAIALIERTLGETK